MQSLGAAHRMGQPIRGSVSASRPNKTRCNPWLALQLSSLAALPGAPVIHMRLFAPDVASGQRDTWRSRQSMQLLAECASARHDDDNASLAPHNRLNQANLGYRQANAPREPAAPEALLCMRRKWLGYVTSLWQLGALLGRLHVSHGTYVTLHCVMTARFDAKPCRLLQLPMTLTWVTRSYSLA